MQTKIKRLDTAMRISDGDQTIISRDLFSGYWGAHGRISYDKKYPFVSMRECLDDVLAHTLVGTVEVRL